MVKRSLTVLITLLLCASWMMDSHAQDTLPTATVARSARLTPSATSLFPLGIYFQLQADLPSDQVVESLELVIQPPNQATTRLTIPLVDNAEFSQSAGLAFANVIWNATDAPPTLFSVLAYTWEMRLSDGTQVEESAQITFVDQRVEWDITHSETLPVSIAIASGGGSSRRLLEEFELVYDFLEKYLGERPTTSLNFAYYKENFGEGCTQNAEGLNRILIHELAIDLPCEPSQANAVYRASNFERVALAPFGYQAIQTHLTEQLMEGVYAPYWVGQSVPKWFRYGLTELVNPAFEPTFLGDLLDATRTEQLFTLEEMNRPPLTQDPRYPLWQAQSFGWMIYLAEQYGLEALFELSRTVANYESFEVAYQTVLGEPLQSLPPTWELWILTPDVATTFRVNFYLSATATPTATATATDIPPTATATLTPTATATATATLPSAVLRLTVSPTDTPVPATPTVTPRSASAIFTATPIPTPNNASLALTLNSTQRQQGIMIFGGMMVMALVLLVGAGIINLFRRGR
ncbi:MAG: hypothetical protein ACOYLB_07225 [Phototrophicaceae bacterium]